MQWLGPRATDLDEGAIVICQENTAYPGIKLCMPRRRAKSALPSPPEKPPSGDAMWGTRAAQFVTVHQSIHQHARVSPNFVNFRYIYAVCVCSDTMSIFVITQNALTRSFFITQY